MTSGTDPQRNASTGGFTPLEGSLGGKLVELLKEIAPRVARVSLLFNPAMATFIEGYLNSFKLGVEPILAPVHDMSELESVIAAQARESNGGLVVIPDAFTIVHRAEITLLAARCFATPSIREEAAKRRGEEGLRALAAS
jgi:putative tryptophan/tyrosine transport system substrate-binding protein